VLGLINTEEYDNPGWHIAAGMRDSVTTVMGYRLFGAAMLDNGRSDNGTYASWPSDLPPDFIDIRCLVEDYVMQALKDSGLSIDQQWQAINYIAYKLATASDPYKSLYLDDISKVTTKHAVEDPSTTEAETNRYADHIFNQKGKLDIKLNDLRVNFIDDYSNKRGAFQTFFHEMGHAIDDVEDPSPFGAETPDYTYNGVTFKEAITTDVRTNLTDTIVLCTTPDPHNSTEDLPCTTDPAQQQRIVDAIMDHTTPQLSAEDTIVLGDLQRFYSGAKGVFRSPEAEAASDIYGAVTNNIITGLGHGGYGHGGTYWDGYDTGPAREFWAGYAAHNIMNDSGKTITITFLPNSTQLADHMADDMKG